MMTQYDAENQIAMLVAPSGGAVIAQTTSSIVIGVFNKDAKSDGGKLQNVHSTFDQVLAMANYLKEQGC